MEALGNYILSLTCAAILFGILQSVLDPKSSTYALFRFIGGLFLTFTVIAPVTDINLDGLLDLPQEYIQQGNMIAAEGQQITREQQRSIIKQQCEAYILDKAINYQIEPKIDVTVSDDVLPIPTQVRITGSVSPYTKKALQNWIEDTMGISGENQLWIG